MGNLKTGRGMGPVRPTSSTKGEVDGIRTSRFLDPVGIGEGGGGFKAAAGDGPLFLPRVCRPFDGRHFLLSGIGDRGIQAVFRNRGIGCRLFRSVISP